MVLTKLIFIFLVAILLSSCGGGGGAGAASSSSINTSGATMMEPTLENVEKIESLVVRNPQDQYSLNSVIGSQNSNILFNFLDVNKSFKETYNKTPYALNQAINITENCDLGGTLSINGRLNQQSGGSANAYYNSCDMGFGIMHGTAKLTVSGYNSTYEDYVNVSTTFVTDFIMTVDNVTTKVLAGSKAEITNLQFDYFYGSILMDMNITAFYVENGITYGQENARIHFDITNPYNPSFYYKGGRFFIENMEKYADYDASHNMSTTPYVTDIGGNLLSGEAKFNLLDGAKATITVIGFEPISAIDADGDGYFELVEN